MLHLYVYVFIYIYTCVCVCACGTPIWLLLHRDPGLQPHRQCDRGVGTGHSVGLLTGGLSRPWTWRGNSTGRWAAAGMGMRGFAICFVIGRNQCVHMCASTYYIIDNYALDVTHTSTGQYLYASKWIYTCLQTCSKNSLSKTHGNPAAQVPTGWSSLEPWHSLLNASTSSYRCMTRTTTKRPSQQFWSFGVSNFVQRVNMLARLQGTIQVCPSIYSFWMFLEPASATKVLTLLGVCALFIVFGAVNYAYYGAQTQPVITLNLPRESPVSHFLPLAFALASLFNVPLFLLPAALQLEASGIDGQMLSLNLLSLATFLTLNEKRSRKLHRPKQRSQQNHFDKVTSPVLASPPTVAADLGRFISLEQLMYGRSMQCEQSSFVAVPSYPSLERTASMHSLRWTWVCFKIWEWLQHFATFAEVI